MYCALRLEALAIDAAVWKPWSLRAAAAVGGGPIGLSPDPVDFGTLNFR